MGEGVKGRLALPEALDFEGRVALPRENTC